MAPLTFLLLALMAAFTLAVPTKQQLAKRSFTVPVRARLPVPARAIAIAHEKWGIADEIEKSPLAAPIDVLKELLGVSNVAVTKTVVVYATVSATTSSSILPESTPEPVPSEILPSEASATEEASTSAVVASTSDSSSASSVAASTSESTSSTSLVDASSSTPDSTSSTFSVVASTSTSVTSTPGSVSSTAGVVPSTALPDIASSTTSALPIIPTTSPLYSNSSTPTQAATDAASSTASADSGEVIASPEENDMAYLSPVMIGGQTLNVDFDTGSADLWVFSSHLTAQETAGHTVYDSTKSPTWTPYDGASWNISYGDGSTASGLVGFDAVSIGGLTFPKQCVEIATEVSGSFDSDVQSDGLLGLGFSNVNTVLPVAQKTFFENIMSSLDEPLFTADLDKNAAGSYEFGTIDSAKYTGDIHYAAVDSSKGYWQFTSKSYAIGGVTAQCATCGPAIADTGTSLMMMDRSVVQAYYAQVSGANFDYTYGGWVYPCDAALPDYGVAFGDDGFIATVKGEDMTYMTVDEGRCFGGLQYGPAGRGGAGGLQILGDMFFKSWFAVFDGGAMRVGVALKSEVVNGV